MNAILDRLFRRARQHQDSTIATYAELVAMVATGDDVPDKRIDEILERSGKTPDDFAEDVRRLTRRRELAVIVQSEMELGEAKRQLRLDRARLGEDWRAACAEFNRRQSELGMREQKLNAGLQAVASAKRELETLSPDAMGKSNELKHEWGFCVNESRRLRARAREPVAQAGQHERLATQRSYSVSPIEHDRLQGEREKNRAAELRAESGALLQEAEELEQRSTELNEQATRERDRLYELAN